MKKSLTERMESHKGTPKSWIAEVVKLKRTIKEKDEKIDEYGNIIDKLASDAERVGISYVEIVDQALLTEEENKRLQAMLDTAHHLRFVDDTNAHEEQMEFWKNVEKALKED